MALPRAVARRLALGRGAGGGVRAGPALHNGINTIPDFAMRDPGRYERAMGLYVVLMLALGIAVALLDRRLRRPVAAA